MGIIKKGILGGFSGKVGTVVGGSWKGIAYMRSLPQNVKNPRTPKQVNHRAKFKIAIQLLQPVAELVRIGWKQHANRQSPMNAALAYTMANVVIGSGPSFTIETDRMMVSHGTLTPASNVTAAIADGNMEFAWDDNSGTGTAKTTDRALIAIVNPLKRMAITNVAGAQRSAKAQTIPLPADWIGSGVPSLEVHMGFMSANGKEVSNSIFVGRIR